MATRKGKALKVLEDGHPRRLADGRNAWRKMNDAQRREFLQFIMAAHRSGEAKLPDGVDIGVADAPLFQA